MATTNIYLAVCIKSLYWLVINSTTIQNSITISAEQCKNALKIHKVTKNHSNNRKFNFLSVAQYISSLI